MQAYEGNATQAAIQAGYSASSARQSAARLMSKAAIRDAIAARQAQDSQELQIGRQEAIQQARENGEPAAMIAGYREIGRLLGYYAPERREVEVTTAAAKAELGRFEAMSDAELLAIAAG